MHVQHVMLLIKAVNVSMRIIKFGAVIFKPVNAWIKFDFSFCYSDFIKLNLTSQNTQLMNGNFKLRFIWKQNHKWEQLQMIIIIKS